MPSHKLRKAVLLGVGNKCLLVCKFSLRHSGGRLAAVGNLVRVMQSLALGPQVAFLEAADPAANRQGVSQIQASRGYQSSMRRVLQLSTAGGGHFEAAFISETLHELGEKFLVTLFRAKLIFKPTMPNEAKLATALRASCMHGQPHESDYASLNSCSDATHSYGSIKLLIRYRRRPFSSGSTALISYKPAAAFRVNAEARI